MSLYERTHPKPEPAKKPVQSAWVKRAIERRLPAKELAA
jgi:hypothetical protein